MDPTYLSRKAMLRRLLDAVGVAALAAPVLHAAGCGAKVVFDGSSQGVGGTGGAGGAPFTGGTDNGSTGAGHCNLSTTGTDGSMVQVTECFAPPDDGCPNQYNAVEHIIPSTPCAYVVSVDCGPVQQGGQCCYLVTEQPQACGMGRPYLVGGEPLTSWAEAREGGWTEGDLRPALDGLDHDARAALAEAWTADGLFEHASVASFSRVSLQLLAVGAPADFVAAVHRAALDEVRHARLCFALAQGYVGAPVAPSPFPLEGNLDLACDLASVAAATAREGCIGETLAAMMAAEQLSRATDPAVRTALAVIAGDETRHAELAWRTVAWAIEAGDASVRAAVVEVFDNAARHLPFAPGTIDEVSPELAAAHGRLDADTSRKALVRALAEVVIPCANALLARNPEPLRGRRGDSVDEAVPMTQRSPC